MRIVTAIINQLNYTYFSILQIYFKSILMKYELGNIRIGGQT